MPFAYSATPFAGRYVPFLSTTSKGDPSYRAPWEPVSTSETPWEILLYPENPAAPSATTPASNGVPTLLPLPAPETGGGKSSDATGGDVKNYDEKWNVGDAPDDNADNDGDGDDGGDDDEDDGGKSGDNTVPPNNSVATTTGKSLPATMVLVIGIILGAFVAMILIVIIVLKMRTQVGGNGGGGGNGAVKCDEQGPMSSTTSGAAPRYQFAAPNDYGDGGAAAAAALAAAAVGRPAGDVPNCSRGLGAAAAAIALLGGRGAPNPGVNPERGPPMNGVVPGNSSMPYGNTMMAPEAPGGHHHPHHPGMMVNGGRSRLFRKTSSSKPVREWYV